MTKYVVIQLRGQQKSVRLKADELVREGPELLLRLNGQQVGMYKFDDVQGWHIIEGNR